MLFIFSPGFLIFEKKKKDSWCLPVIDFAVASLKINLKTFNRRGKRVEPHLPHLNDAEFCP